VEDVRREDSPQRHGGHGGENGSWKRVAIDTYRYIKIAVTFNDAC
jgi:hypothetical protein